MTRLRLRVRFLPVAMALLVLFAAICAPAAPITAELGAKEVEMGKEAAAEIAKESPLSTNAEDLKRLREMGEKLAAIANKTEFPAVYGSATITPFEYTFNIIEEDDINAFSVPGGFIYVYRGLLDFVQSDDELAGVVAHEIIHASHHHMAFLLRKQASLQNTMAIALLAAMLSGASSADVGNVALGVQLYQIARLNGYGMQAERDSDAAGIKLMHAGGYNPVGLLTFLERLARRPELIDYGIYRSHPLDSERVAAAKKLINDMGLTINRRQTTNAAKAIVRADEVAGVETPGVVLRNVVIYRPAAQDGKSAQELAEETAAKINSALDSNLMMHELRLDSEAAAVTARGRPLVVVSQADARLMQKSPAEVAGAVAAAVRDVIWKEMVDAVH